MAPRLILTIVVATFVPVLEVSARAQAPAEVAAAQPTQFDAPAYVSVVDGGATLERDGQVETAPLNMPVLTGDRLRTSDGRLEVRFADGGRLQLDTRTAVDVLSDDLVRLTDGRIRVSVVRAAQQVAYRVDSPAGSARILQPGEYRVSVLHGTGASGAPETQLELAVVSGGGEIFTGQGSTPVRAGERAYASDGLMPSYAYAFNAATTDDFDRWSDRQRGTVYAGASQSAEYLPQEMASYAPTFDQYGAWQYQQDYGYVWYPRVAADWRPYYYGRWATYPSYGWTWIAADPFGYPTHHYGRWGIRGGVWFWIPSRSWAPAYVSWGFAADYVSWCPLGWDNRAVFSIGLFNTGSRYYRAWTVVPRSRFGHGYAYQHAVNWDRGVTSVRPRFSEGRAPTYDRAMERRTAAPVRYAGTRASVSRAPSPVRAETPRYINRGDEIIRSQTGRPVPPSRPSRVDDSPRVMDRETAITRTAPAYGRPSSGAAAGNSRPDARTPSYDAPSYRAPVYRAPTYTAPTYSAPRGYERATPRISPRGESTPGRAEPRQTPQAQPYPSAAPPSRPPQYQPPPNRGGEMRSAPQYQPPNRGGEMRSAPQYQPPSRGYERPAERAAPPSRPSGGGERAFPRAGGPRGEARAAGARSRGGSR
jgi:hypothetical protein